MSKGEALFKRKPRLDGWSKQTVLYELRADPKLTVEAICKSYAVPGVTHYKTLQRDIAAWQRDDPDFAADYQQILRDRGVVGGPGASPSDEDNDDWEMRFIMDYLVFGTKEEASKRAPLSLRQINRRLSPDDPNYDAEFANLFAEAEQRLNSEFEGGIVSAFREAQQPRDRAWIAKIWLERRDPKRWGKQVEMIHSGQVKHEHVHTLGGKSKEQRLAELAADQSAFFSNTSTKTLPAPASAMETLQAQREVIDAELVE